MRKFAAIAVSVLLATAGASSASAATNDAPEPEPLHVTTPYDGPAYIDDSADAPSADELRFANAEDPADEPGGIAPRCVVCGAPVMKTVKVSGPVLVQKKFVKYLTGAWAKSTGYSWSESTTVSATISAGAGVSAASASSNIGVSASQTKNYSITVNIAASSSKYSKLGLASNFNRYSVKSAMHQNGKLVPGATWKYGDLYSPTKDQYLVVYYQ